MFCHVLRIGFNAIEVVLAGCTIENVEGCPDAKDLEFQRVEAWADHVHIRIAERCADPKDLEFQRVEACADHLHIRMALVFQASPILALTRMGWARLECSRRTW